MWRLCPLLLALFMLAWPAIPVEAGGDCPDPFVGKNGTVPITVCAWDAEPYDPWRQTSQGWQRCENFLGPPIEYRRPALHPAVVGTLEVLLSVTALLALGERHRA